MTGGGRDTPPLARADDANAATPHRRRTTHSPCLRPPPLSQVLSVVDPADARARAGHGVSTDALAFAWRVARDLEARGLLLEVDGASAVVARRE